MKKFILIILTFISNLYNSFIILLGIFLSKLLFISRDQKLISQIKNLWLFIIQILNKPTNNLNIFINIKKILKNFYFIIILLFFTILIYSIIFFFFNLLVISFSTCNKGFLFFIIYIYLYIFLIKNDTYFNQFWDQEFDWDENFNYFSEWEEEEDELNAPTSSWEEDLNFADIVDSFDEITNDSDQNELFLNYIEIYEEKSFSIEQRNILEELDSESAFVDDIYLFERWYNLSNEIFNIFYKNRLQNYKKKKKIKLFITNASLLIDNKFLIYSKFFKIISKKNILINSENKLKNFMLYKFLLNYFLSDNLILYFRLYRRIMQLKYNRFYKNRKFGLKYKKLENFEYFSKAPRHFWGGKMLDNLFYKENLKSFFNKDFLFNNHLITNYNLYIFQDKIFEYYPNDYSIQENFRFKSCNFQDLVSYDYECYSYIYSLSNSNFLLNILKKDFFSYTESKSILIKQQYKKIVDNNKSFEFDFNSFIINNIVKKKIKLSDTQENLILQSIIFNAKLWFNLEKFYNNKFFERIITIILNFLIKKFKNFKIKQRNNFFYLQEFILNFFENEFKLLLQSSFFSKYLRINFQKIFLITISCISDKLYKTNLTLNENIQFYFLFRLFFYKFLLPEQDFYNSSLNFLFLYNQYFTDKSNLFFFSFTKPIRHIFLNLKSNFKKKLLLYNINNLDIKYIFSEIDLPLHRESNVPDNRELLGALGAFEKYNKFSIHVSDLVLKWLEVSYTSHYIYSFLLRKYFLSNKLKKNKSLNFLKIFNNSLDMKGVLHLFDNFFYYFFYGFKFFFKTTLKYSYFIGLQNNLKHYFDFLIKENENDLINKETINSFLFPYINYTNKFYKNSKFYNKNLFGILQELIKNSNDFLYYTTFSSIFEKKTLKRINLLNYNNIQFNLLLILFLVNNEYSTFLRDEKLILLKNSINSINNLIYKNYFIKNILNRQSIKKQQINNFSEFKNSLVFFFSNNHYAFSVYFNQLKQNTFKLRYKDFAVLSHLANHFWLYGMYNDIRDYSFSVADQTVEWFQDKVLLKEPYDLDLSVSNLDADYLYKDDGALLEVIDSVIYDVSEDFFDQNEHFFDHMTLYIDEWLQKKSVPLHFFDAEGIYALYFQSIFTLWVICRMQWIMWSGTDYDHGSKSTTIPILNDLVEYEDFSDTYKNSNMDVVSCYSNELGVSLQGDDYGIFDRYLWASAGLQATLEEEQMYEEFAFGGKVLNEERYEDHEEFTDKYYFIEEQLYDTIDLEGFYPDFFRNYVGKNAERRISKIIKWNIFSDLQKSIFFLDSSLLHFLYLKNRRQRNLVKWHRPKQYALGEPLDEVQAQGYRYFVQPKLKKHKLNEGFYLYKPQQNSYVESSNIFYKNFLYENLIFDKLFRTNFELKNLIRYLLLDYEFLLLWLKKSANKERLEKWQYAARRMRSIEEESWANESKVDELAEFLQRVSESNSVVMNPSYYRQNVHQRRFEEFAIEYDEYVYVLDDISEMFYRLLANLNLATKQTLYYRLENVDKAVATPYKEFILNLFYKNFLQPIQSNVTIYGTDLTDNYFDSLEILPVYFGFLQNLSKYEQLKLLAQVPDFYKLLFDNLYFFLNDPYLTTSYSPWYVTIYNNPWFLKQKIKYKYNKMCQEYLDINIFNSSILESFLITNNFGRALDYFISSEGDLYQEIFALLFKGKDSFLVDTYEISKFMVMRYEQILFGMYGSLDLDLLNFVKNSNNSQGFHKLMRQIMKRRPIRERFIVPIDQYQEFTLKGYVDDPIIRKPRWGFEIFRHVVLLIGRLSGGDIVGFVSPTHKNSILNKAFLKINPYIKNLLNQDFEYINQNRSHYNYNNNKNFIFLQDKNFRQLDKETWDTYWRDNLLHLALQYIENRYRFSDRLFATHPNFNFEEALDRTGAGDFFALETEVDSVWFELEEINLPEAVRPAMYEVKNWDKIILSLLEYPRAMPPIFIFNWVTGGVFPFKDFLLRNYNIFPKDRFLDPICDAEFLDGYQVTLEEGEVTLKYFMPFFIFLFDFFSKYVFQLLGYLEFFSKNSYLLQNYGSGDFTARSFFLQNISILSHFYKTRKIKLYNSFFFQSNFEVELANSYYFKLINFLFNYFFNRNLNEFSFLYLVITNFFYLKYRIISLINYLNSVTNFSLFRDGLNYTLIIILFIIGNFLILIPLTYIITIIRSWIFYPFDLDDDDLALEDYDQYYDRNIETIIHPYSISHIESDSHQKLNQSIEMLYVNSSLFDEYLFDPIIFFFKSKDQIFDYNHILHLSLKNELFYYLDITLPGYKFTYNLFDIFTYIDNCNFSYKGNLPFYHRFYIEYLHILLGARITSSDLQMNFYEQSYFYQTYFFAADKYRLLQHSDNFVNIEDFIFKKNKFKDRHIKGQNINIFKNNLLKKENFNEINQDDRLLELSQSDSNYRVILKKNRVNIDYYKEINIPLRTLWLSNKYILNTLKILDFSFNILTNNDFFKNLVWSETHNIQTFLNLNLLTIISNKNSFFFLSKNNLLKMQYQPGDKICPFYLRFQRSIDSFHSSSDYFYNFLSDDLFYLYDSNFNFQSNFFTKLNNISMTDLNLLIPFNQEGVLNFEILFAYLINIKLLFSEALVIDELKSYENLILDFHNLEVNKFYSRSFFAHFQELEDFSENFDFSDWLKLIEEQKEWSIFLEDDRFISLFLEDEVLTSFDERFTYSTQLNLQRKIRPLYLIRRVLSLKNFRTRIQFKGVKSIFFMDGRYRRRNHGKSNIFKTRLRYGTTLKKYAKYYVSQFNYLKKKQKKILEMNLLKKTRFQQLPLKLQIDKSDTPKIRSSFISLSEPKFQTYHDIYYLYAFTPFEKVQFTNQFQVPFNFTEYLVSFNDQAVRYLEIFNFPSKDFKFSLLFNNIPDENVFEYNSIFLRKKKSDNLISNQVFFDLITKQYISTNVFVDLFAILTPEGNAVNKRLTNLSNIQMYEYLNIHLNIKLQKKFTFKFVDLMGCISVNKSNLIIKRYINQILKICKNLFLVMIFIGILLCYFVL